MSNSSQNCLQFPEPAAREPWEKVFIFRTAGGVAPVNYNASKPVIRRLVRKGYDVI